MAAALVELGIEGLPELSRRAPASGGNSQQRDHHHFESVLAGTNSYRMMVLVPTWEDLQKLQPGAAGDGRVAVTELTSGNESIELKLAVDTQYGASSATQSSPILVGMHYRLDWLLPTAEHTQEST